MLKIVDINSNVPEIETPFKFPLDPFQKHAVYAISKDENVLVTAKTGSGKTLVGEYQIYHSLSKGKRVFYTTPIKSLSNQKFYDLKKMFPSVGIMTGDIKFMPQADIVIMTTEILRNLLFKQGTFTENIGITSSLSLENLDAIVFDEVHYINDIDRGKVWEECLTLVPRDINLVMLSATIEKPEKFASWLGDIKQKPIHLISTEYRIVPLVHLLPDKTVVMDSKETFNQQNYTIWFHNLRSLKNEERRHKERVKSRQEGDDVVKQGEHTTSFVDRMNKLIGEIELPALFFVFSRKLCASLANKVSHTLITSSEGAEMKHILKFHLHKYPELQTIGQYHDMVRLLEKGVAYHHSGVIPILKEIVEILFSRGFIKVLFATETFAVGINMPTKSVVFTSYRKRDDYTDGFRLLTTSEYTQMAGRAGRRGKDDKGFVYYLPMDDPEEVLDVKTMMTGVKSELTSRMDFHYSYILSSIQSGKHIQNESYWAKERQELIQTIKTEIEENLKSLDQSIDDKSMKDLELKSELESKIKDSVNAEKKRLQTELNKWNNTHMGPKWEKNWKSFKKNNETQNHIQYLKNCVENLSDYDLDIRHRKEFLEYYGFLKEGKLTQKGILASEVHEGHVILMPHIYVNKLLHNETAENITIHLSVFLQPIRTEEKIIASNFLVNLQQDAEEMREHEVIQSPNDFWELTSYWEDVVKDWINGNDHVCEKYEVDYGNFVKAILKLSNIIDEWVNMATIVQDVEMIEKMKDIKSKLVRSFVVPNSLYLQI